MVCHPEIGLSQEPGVWGRRGQLSHRGPRAGRHVPAAVGLHPGGASPGFPRRAVRHCIPNAMLLLPGSSPTAAPVPSPRSPVTTIPTPREPCRLLRGPQRSLACEHSATARGLCTGHPSPRCRAEREPGVLHRALCHEMPPSSSWVLRRAPGTQETETERPARQEGLSGGASGEGWAGASEGRVASWPSRRTAHGLCAPAPSGRRRARKHGGSSHVGSSDAGPGPSLSVGQGAGTPAEGARARPSVPFTIT